jgi:DNA polymerase III subunit beta
MKIVCTQSDLKTNLSSVSRVVPSRPTHPILGNVLLVADKQTQQVSLTGFDLSLGIRTSFNAEVSIGGSITLPAKLFNDIVSRLSEGEITLYKEETPPDGLDSLAVLTSASGRFQMRGIDAQNYPELPLVKEGQAVMLPVSVLMEGLKGVLFAASTEEVKQILSGVHLKCSQDGLEFAATDSHRLIVVETKWEDYETNESSPKQQIDDFAVTIPARALRELERMLSLRHQGGLVGLYFDKSQVVFELETQYLSSRKLEGAYPAYQQLLPRQFARTVTLERKRLLNSLEIVSVLADQKNNLVKFYIDSDKGQLSLSVESQDLGSAKEIISAQITGESLEIGFNIRYLLDGLKVFPTKEIQMQLNQENQPVIFTPLGGLKMTYLVMPVQVRS